MRNLLTETCLNINALVVPVDIVAKSVADSCGNIEHLYNVHIYEQQLKKAETVATVHAEGIELSETGI
jgi:thymidylate synthase